MYMTGLLPISWLPKQPLESAASLAFGLVMYIFVEMLKHSMVPPDTVPTAVHFSSQWWGSQGTMCAFPL